MVSRLLTLLTVAAAVALTNAQAPARCFECTDIPDPADCTQTTTCATGQKCVIEQYISSGGLVLYKSGCESQARCNARKKRTFPRPSSLLSKRDDVLTCDECCDGDFCNDQGCAQAALKQPARGLLCFQCEVEKDPHSCRHLVECDIGEICMLHKLQQRAPDGSAIYKSMCIHPRQCDAYALLVGKKKRNTYCHVCCHDDYCNDRCDKLVNPAPTTPSTPPTTTMPTTITTTKRPTTTTPTTTTTTPKLTTTHRLTPPDKCRQHRQYHYTSHLQSHICYKFHFELKSWNDANDICRQEGGHLAIVDNQDKWYSLQRKISNENKFTGRIFIGARSQSRHFHWINGDPITFNDWESGEPNGHHDECVSLWNKNHWSWHDINCSDRYQFVCTIDV